MSLIDSGSSAALRFCSGAIGMFCRVGALQAVHLACCSLAFSLLSDVSHLCALHYNASLALAGS